MLLLIRGHIRNCFDNNDFYILLKSIIEIVETIDDLDIYIQTWNIKQSNISWRTLEEIVEEVTEETIYTYFRDLNPYIKHISILDDKKIQLIGDLSGNICDTKAPKIGWKNMLYGICHELNHIKENVSTNPLIINMRFDLANNSFPLHSSFILSFINENLTYSKPAMKVINDSGCPGIDNIYIGKLDKMHGFINNLYLNLDKIIKKYMGIFHHELIFFYENNPRIVFSNKIQDGVGKDKLMMPPMKSKIFKPAFVTHNILQNSKKTYGKVYLDSVNSKWAKFT
jgi:hypothetical protein